MEMDLIREFLVSLGCDHIDYAEIYAGGESSVQAHLLTKFNNFQQLVKHTAEI
jgi:hypothetical protein